MAATDRRLLVCDCEGTMPLDGRTLGRACGRDIRVHTHLCRTELAAFEAAAGDGEPLLVCCTQEAPLFTETVEEIAGASEAEPDIRFVNIRERAGWSDEAASATPKIAALIAEAAVDVAPARSLTIVSEGRVIVYGRDETAIAAARRLADHLAVTAILTRPGDVTPPAMTDMPLFAGTITGVAGHFGAFRVTLEGAAPARPSSRGRLEFEPAGGETTLDCDLIVDLSGGAPLLSAPEKRDGYLRPDPGNPAAVERALAEAADLVGEFDKPIYIDYDANLCAHARSGVTGCTRCIDTCPASAIEPDGNQVRIDAHVCAGCGGCASVCPTGAARYTMPADDALFRRLRTLLEAYREAGGRTPTLLIHDSRHGEEMIGIMARLGRGLPAGVLPFAVNEVTRIGFDMLATALAYGANRIVILARPGRRDELAASEDQIALADAALTALGHGAGRIALVDEADPDSVADLLYGLAAMAEIPPAGHLAMGGKRTLTAMALEHLHRHAPTPQDIIDLPAGAPFGGVELAAGCTLCLSCVGACPTGALTDNPESPMLRFSEQACVQCGLCRSTCPESVMTLVPRFNFSGAAGREVILHEEPPFECVSCGKPFATRAAIEKTVERLSAHAMFADDPAALERLRMCEDCRVMAQFGEAQPMALGAPRRPRTTDDYLAARNDAARNDEDD